MPWCASGGLRKTQFSPSIMRSGEPDSSCPLYSGCLYQLSHLAALLYLLLVHCYISRERRKYKASYTRSVLLLQGWIKETHAPPPFVELTFQAEARLATTTQITVITSQNERKGVKLVT